MGSRTPGLEGGAGRLVRYWQDAPRPTPTPPRLGYIPPGKGLEIVTCLAQSLDSLSATLYTRLTTRIACGLSIYLAIYLGRKLTCKRIWPPPRMSHDLSCAQVATLSEDLTTWCRSSSHPHDGAFSVSSSAKQYNTCMFKIRKGLSVAVDLRLSKIRMAPALDQWSCAKLTA